MDWVINCTGPQLDTRGKAGASPLHLQLHDEGLVAPEPTGAGLLCDISTGRVLEASHLKPSRHLWAIGPTRKGSEWETIAVREIRDQGEQVASGLYQALGAYS